MFRITALIPLVVVLILGVLMPNSVSQSQEPATREEGSEAAKLRIVPLFLRYYQPVKVDVEASRQYLQLAHEHFRYLLDHFGPNDEYAAQLTRTEQMLASLDGDDEPDEQQNQ